MRLSTRVLGSVAACAAGLSLLNACGLSGTYNPGLCGAPCSVTQTKAMYAYTLQMTNPVTVTRFYAGVNGSVIPNETITLPSDFNAIDLKADLIGNLYVDGTTSTGTREVLVYADGGSSPTRTVIVTEYGPLAIAKTGEMYLAGESTNTVYVYAANANGVSTPSKMFTYGGFTPGAVIDMALDSANNVYLDIDTFSTSSAQIVEFASNASGASTPMRTIALSGVSYSMAVDGTGNVYASSTSGTIDAYVGTVQVFGTASTPTRTIRPSAGSAVIAGMKVDSAGYIYALMQSGLSTNLTESLVMLGPTQNGIVTPQAIATSAALTMYTGFELAIR